jgi:hypothetical protein
MPILTTPSHEPAARAGLETPAVVNVRRPAGPRADASHSIAPAQIDLRTLGDAPPPPTLLRLPDLDIIIKSLRKRSLSMGAAAQWIGIGLGGLLALWLIFGGIRHAPLEVDEAPPWNPPASAQLQSAPAWQPSTEAAPAPAYSQQAIDADSQSLAPAAPGIPNNESPYPNDPQPPQLPEWDESAGRAAVPPGAEGPVARTAQRVDVPLESATDNRQPGEAPPLGITVPVPQ